MHPWHDVDLPVRPHAKGKSIPVVIEIPAGERNKYELDLKTGLLRLKKAISAPVRYPANYGFIPRTLAPDGDPLDALVITREPVVPMCVVWGRIAGSLPVRDDKGRDDKLILVHDQVDASPGMIDQIAEFFLAYKRLDDVPARVDRPRGRSEARRLLRAAIERYDRKFKEGDK